jgi:hypothetical protein
VLPAETSPVVIGLVVILSPSSKAGEPLIKPVMLPSRFCFQFTTEGTPGGALCGAALALGTGFLAGTFLAGAGEGEVAPSDPPKSEIVLRAAGGAAFGAGAGAGADLAAPPKRLMVAPGGAFSTDFFAAVAAFFFAAASAAAARLASAAAAAAAFFSAAAAAAAAFFSSASRF